MKTLFFSIVLSTLFFAACNNDSSKDQAKENTSAETETKMSEPAASDNAVSDLLDGYIKIKNALVADNDKEAATAGSEMTKAFENFDIASLTPEQAKVYSDIEEDAKEHAEHIGANAGNIEHQREHFETLSQEMYELVKSVGAGQELYYTHCPMYNNNKGANWLSETEEVQNPYLGQSMSKCGSVKEKLN